MVGFIRTLFCLSHSQSERRSDSQPLANDSAIDKPFLSEKCDFNSPKNLELPPAAVEESECLVDSEKIDLLTIIPLAKYMDTLGPITKSAYDAALLLTHMVGFTQDLGADLKQ